LPIWKVSSYRLGPDSASELRRPPAAQRRYNVYRQALENQIASTDAAGEELGGFVNVPASSPFRSATQSATPAEHRSRTLACGRNFGRERDRADQLEADRLRLTRELALARSEAESREAQLRAIPRGADAVADFLAEEEARIDQDLVIKQGGDRLRAEQEHTMREKLERNIPLCIPRVRAAQTSRDR